VFGTLHTNTAPSTVDRIIDQFPADRQNQIRTMLASSLKGVIAQTLCKKKPKGRAAALEILVVNTAIAANIREGKTHGIVSSMQMGGKLGMRLLNDSLLELVRSGSVEASEAYLKSVNKDDMLAKLQSIGVGFDPSKFGEGAESPAAIGALPTGPAPSAPRGVNGPASATPAPAPRAPIPQQAANPAPATPASSGTTPQKGWNDPFEQFKKQRPS
jgi:hypothetical protein